MDMGSLIHDKLWLQSLWAATTFHWISEDVMSDLQYRWIHVFLIPMFIFYVCRSGTTIRDRPPHWSWWLLTGFLSYDLGHTASWLHEQLAISTTDMDPFRRRNEIFYLHAVLAHEVVLALVWLLPPIEGQPHLGPRMRTSRNWTLVQGAWYMISMTAVLAFVGDDTGKGFLGLSLTFPLWLHLCGLRKAMYWLFYMENELVWYVKKSMQRWAGFLKAGFTTQVAELDRQGQ